MKLTARHGFQSCRFHKSSFHAANVQSLHHIYWHGSTRTLAVPISARATVENQLTWHHAPISPESALLGLNNEREFYRSNQVHTNEGGKDPVLFNAVYGFNHALYLHQSSNSLKTTDLLKTRKSRKNKGNFKIYSGTGWRDDGQLGHLTCSANQCAPSNDVLNLGADSISVVSGSNSSDYSFDRFFACGDCSFGYSQEHQRLYAWGNNEYQQLVNDKSRDKITQPLSWFSLPPEVALHPDFHICGTGTQVWLIHPEWGLLSPEARCDKTFNTDKLNDDTNSKPTKTLHDQVNRVWKPVNTLTDSGGELGPVSYYSACATHLLTAHIVPSAKIKNAIEYDTQEKENSKPGHGILHDIYAHGWVPISGDPSKSEEYVHVDHCLKPRCIARSVPGLLGLHAGLGYSLLHTRQPWR